jgi:hypothetical protein
VPARQRVAKVLSLNVLGFMALFASALPVEGGLIDKVTTSAEFFNPGLRQSVTLGVSVSAPGHLSAVVLDRDGYVVRTLPSVRATSPGQLALQWDGKNDDGMVVPDEAYSFKVDFASAGVSESYFPANTVSGKHLALRAESFDRRSGTLRYTLPIASRVHIQAGSAKVDPKSGATTGPVLKTIVNRAPRTAGSVIENWPGFDETGTIYVPGLPDFVISIAATPLPQNSVITVGNRTERFAEALARRRGAPLLASHPPSHHHGGLTTLDDMSPVASLTPKNAAWMPEEKVWTANDSKLEVSVKLSGPNAVRFMSHPGRVLVFVDQNKVVDLPATQSLKDITVPLPSSPGDRVVAVNWVSDYGPVAVSSFRVRRSNKS